MITFSPSLAASLATATTKTDWANKLQTGLGPTRRLRMFRDANANASDPTATGTEFLNVGMTGNFVITAGDISSLGVTSGTTVRTAVDLLTGTSALTIEGNGNWVKMSVGLTIDRQTALGVASVNLKTFDFALYDQPKVSSGVGFLVSAGIKAPLTLSSGTGPTAPDLDADAPVIYEVLTYPNNDTTPVSAGEGFITVRDPDMVFDRDYIAKSVGDVRVMRSAAGTGVVFGNGGEQFRTAPTLLVVNKAANADNPNKPVYRMRFLTVPHNRWSNFPFRGTFNVATDTTILPAHKIVLKRADRSVIEVLEMYSSRVGNTPGTSKPVNASTQVLEFDPSTRESSPSQPFFTCHMSHSYSSANFKPMMYMNDLFPGMESDVMDEHNVVAFDAGPDDWPVIGGGGHINGLLSYRVSPKWSRPYNGGFDTTIIDPLYVDPGQGGYVTQWVGHGFEPASSCQHVWFMSPGGSRHDRAMWADIVARFVTNKNGVRVHGAVTYKDLYRNWQLGYHNEGCHYATNPELGQTLDKAFVLYGRGCYNDTYYSGGNEDYRPDLPNTAVRLLTLPAGGNIEKLRDFKGRRFTNEYQRDDQHNISNAANMLYFGGDPMGALEARDSYNSNMLCAFNMTQGFVRDDFLSRQHAWYFKHLVETWIVGSNNPNCMSSADIEFIAGNHLATVYDAIAPLMDPANTSPAAIVLRTFGQMGNIYTYTPPDADAIAQLGSATLGIISLYDSKQFYMGLPLMLAKQSGFYDRMKAYSSKASQALDIIILCMNKASIDCFVDCQGRADRLGYAAHANFFFPLGQQPSPLNWFTITAQTGTMKEATVGQTTFIHNKDGGFDGYIEGYNTQHFRAQWPFILDRYFPEVTYPRAAQARTIIDGFYATVETMKNNGTGPYWHWRFAHMGKPKAPAKVGPPVVT